MSDPSLDEPAPKRKAAFKASRLTPTTWVLTEHSDVYDEHPLIYAKVLPAQGVILLIDTGCGGATDDDEIDVRSLREYMETIRIPANDNKPLNDGGKMRYAVLLTHCHYDHILGVEQFAKDSTILASAYSPSFIAPENLAEHSLCASLGIPTPQYSPTLVAHREPLPGLGPATMLALHTPGHTPDELAVWDADERVLYVGDTLYEWAHIIFPREGSLVEWVRSVDMLLDLVGRDTPAKICAGHVTAGRPARDVLTAARAFMMDVVEGRERVKRRFEKRGEICVEYIKEGMRFSLLCPERLVLEAQKHFKGI
ncbi:MBL fold metallo-hydrolase [Phanerochaete sordida]|uniref:MBL fold metallo-hydrolase n=1 Tax=Phanerochaete sordida TaxID=48140 RepID=A0A9P3GKV5_9APHY|nr:MBL fold metallo-hydrolase [Phanerochaete sordida]